MFLTLVFGCSPSHLTRYVMFAVHGRQWDECQWSFSLLLHSSIMFIKPTSLYKLSRGQGFELWGEAQLTVGLCQSSGSSSDVPNSMLFTLFSSLFCVALNPPPLAPLLALSPGFCLLPFHPHLPHSAPCSPDSWFCSRACFHSNRLPWKLGDSAAHPILLSPGERCSKFFFLSLFLVKMKRRNFSLVLFSLNELVHLFSCRDPEVVSPFLLRWRIFQFLNCVSSSRGEGRFLEVVRNNETRVCSTQKSLVSVENF